MAESGRRFRNARDRESDTLARALPHGVHHWGLAQRLNIFLRDALYKVVQCRAYGLYRIERWLEVPVIAPRPRGADERRCPLLRVHAIVAATGLSVIAGAAPVAAPVLAGQLAGQQVYTYSVRHPVYGQIGTLTEIIDRGPETTRIDAHLRIAVKFLGIVVSRQETDTTEIMRGDRLLSLQSVTEKDGQHFEVHGEAQGDGFVVNTTAGSFAGPAAIAPSDPWVLKRTGEQTVVFTDTGRTTKMYISGGDYETISVNGASVSARHFVVMGDKRQEVWLNNREIPIMFRTVENGTPIDFMLGNATAAEVAPRLPL